MLRSGNRIARAKLSLSKRHGDEMLSSIWSQCDTLKHLEISFAPGFDAAGLLRSVPFFTGLEVLIISDGLPSNTVTRLLGLCGNLTRAEFPNVEGRMVTGAGGWSNHTCGIRSLTINFASQQKIAYFGALVSLLLPPTERHFDNVGRILRQNP